MSKTFKQLREELSGVGPDGQLVYLDEASLGRIYQHTQKRNIGVITAHRSENSPEDNHAANRSLESDIREHGFGFHHIDGHYTENKGTPHERHVQERSYLVVGKEGEDGGHLKNFLTTHGEKYGQETVLHKAHNESQAKLIGTKSGVGWIGKGEESSVGDYHPGRADEFHSVIRSRRSNDQTKKFSFGESLAEGVEYEEIGITENLGQGFFGAWGKAVAEKK